MDQSTGDAETFGNAPIKGQKHTHKPSDLALREEGRSLLPISRVQKIIKADRELPIVSKEAVFAISIATEEFIKRITSASQRQAERENRTTVQRKDIVIIAGRAEEFFFLEDFLVRSYEEKTQNIKRSNRNVKAVAGTEFSL